MLRLFFNRKSLFVLASFWGAAFLTALFFWQGKWSLFSTFQQILFVFALFQILFAKAVDAFPWHGKDALGPGIGLQFQKAIVPVSYLWLSLMGLLWWKPITFVLVIYNLLFLPIGFVACLLIYFYGKDPDRAAPNPLSGAPPPSSSPETQPPLCSEKDAVF